MRLMLSLPRTEKDMLRLGQVSAMLPVKHGSLERMNVARGHQSSKFPAGARQGWRDLRLSQVPGLCVAGYATEAAIGQAWSVVLRV